MSSAPVLDDDELSDDDDADEIPRYPVKSTIEQPTFTPLLTATQSAAALASPPAVNVEQPSTSSHQQDQTSRASPSTTTEDTTNEMLAMKVDGVAKQLAMLLEQNSMLFELVSAISASKPINSHTITKNSDIALPTLPLSSAEEVNRIDVMLLDMTFNEQMASWGYRCLRKSYL